MRICLKCASEIKSSEWNCVKCGWAPECRDGVVQFAPHISGAGEGYDPVWYAELASLEANNFWFVARNRLLKWLAKRFLPQSGNYLEVGCGTGFVLQMMSGTFPDWTLYATEAQLEGIEFARQRVQSNVTFFQMDACAIPFRQEFDVVGAFDVIEHIRDDAKAIGEIYASLKPDGYFILSVPQHMFLWSKYDEVGCHFRRYSAMELESKLKEAGFVILESTSFNSLLLPLMLLSRYFKNTNKNGDLDVLEELRLSSFMNFALSFVLKLEFALLCIGIRWPVGGSRVVVAKKIIELKDI